VSVAASDSPGTFTTAAAVCACVAGRLEQQPDIPPLTCMRWRTWCQWLRPRPGLLHSSSGAVHKLDAYSNLSTLP
jgi:hypothetical protein